MASEREITIKLKTKYINNNLKDNYNYAYIKLWECIFSLINDNFIPNQNPIYTTVKPVLRGHLWDNEKEAL
jgi:hypothetical protein